MGNKIITIALLILSVLACRKEQASNEESLPLNHQNFSFSTENLVQLSFDFHDNSGQPLSRVRMSLWTALPEEGGKKLFTFITNQNGSFHEKVNIPAHLTSLILVSNYIGLVNNLELPIHSNTISLRVNGSTNVQGFLSRPTPLPKNTDFTRQFKSGPTLSYLGSFNNDGVPNYLESTNDQISASFLSNINASLPESKPVPNFHPDYLDTSKLADLMINQLSDVWITFVHEGAGYKNTLCFYAYNKNNPPQTTSDIDSIRVIFPNVSYSGSGGGLTSGNKVKIGRFGADTVIGFALIANGYSNGSIGNGLNIFYSDFALNPETNNALKQHHVLLRDQNTGRMLFAFEDIHRQSSSDEDFNDAVFFASTNPVEAYETSNVNPIDIPTDSDNDGISDLYDDYPNDNQRAFDNVYPYSGGFATVSFEDLWPGKGDYDMNDLNIGYQFNLVCNPENKVMEIKSRLCIQSAGASYQNAFAWEFPFSPSAISSVTGLRITGNMLSLNSNGTESGQSKAVVFAFDDQYKVIQRIPGQFINTQSGQSRKTGDTLSILISLNTPLSLATVGLAPFNPFIVANKVRGNEIHLPNHAPTEKANTQLFGTSHDRSNANTGRYYLTEDGMPWALNFPDQFDHPKEKSSIQDAYTKFSQWSSSGGQLYPDWYLNISGYRNNTLIY